MKLPDSIKENIKILDLVDELGLSVKRVGNQYFLKEHDSVCIDPHKNVYHRFSSGTGGSVIDFVMEFMDLSQDEAILKLRGKLSNSNTNFSYKTSANNVKPPKELSHLDYKDIKEENIDYIMNGLMSRKDIDFFKDYDILGEDARYLINDFNKFTTEEDARTFIKQTLTEFRLPEKFDGKMSRLFAYMNKERGLQYEVIKDMVDRRMLYEDKNFHNAVFVGFDYDDEPKYATKRSTVSSNYKTQLPNAFSKADVPRSNKKVGFFVDNESPTLILCEAPIDAMSIMSITKLHDVDHKKYSYLAQGGTSMASVNYHLDNNPNVNKFYLAYDNDEAGDNARFKARTLLKQRGFNDKQIIDKPPHNNDFNDDLRIIHLKVSTNLEQTKEINLCRN